MSGYIYFQMWGPFRESLIRGHQFYIEQAQRRLLSQFDDIEKEADEAGELWLQQNGHRFDPDRHDPADFFESAHDAGIDFYQLLDEMRDRTRLSVLAGMYHEWDKQLRAWLVGEVKHWHRGDAVPFEIWKVDFVKLAELLDGLGWGFRAAPFFEKLDACRLVVNVYKHGDGKSFQDLRESYPEYLQRPLSRLGDGLFGTDFLDYKNLVVSDAQLQEFSDAILEFWRSIPENTSEAEIPAWLDKAFTKDQA
jgi:hypothetical protein